MSRSVKIREQLISSFRAELAEHLQTMTDGLLALEQDRVAGEQRQATLEAILRAAHSLKGAARAVSLSAIEQLAHSLESVLDAMQRQAVPLTSELFTICYRAIDAIQAMQATYEAGETAPPLEALVVLADLEGFRRRPRPAPLAATQEPADGARASSTSGTSAPPASRPAGAAWQAAAAGPAGDETIRIDVAKLDALMAQLGELIVSRIRAEQRLAQTRQLQDTLAQCQKSWTLGTGARPASEPAPPEGHASFLPSSSLPAWPGISSRASTGRAAPGGEIDRLRAVLATAQRDLGQVSAVLENLAHDQAADLAEMSQVIDALDQEIKRMRLLPLSTVTAPFGRMVRDLAQNAGKEAVLHVTGGAIELDKRILEQVKDPLIHLLRNAIDHGIESPEQREALDKPRAGTIQLRAERAGQDVLISVADDGAGLDMDALRRALARHGRENAAFLSDAEVTDLIFAAGVTTSPIITDISGRGIGLSVVRRNAEALHGRASVTWTVGQGACFTLTLPLTLTSARGLVVRAGGQPFVLPLDAVERIRPLAAADVLPMGGLDTVYHGGRPLALVRLDSLLSLPGGTGRPTWPVPAIVLRAGDRHMVLIVDELLGEQEVVIKGLGRQLRRVGGIGGATVMGTGEVVLILNAGDLFKLAARGERRSVLAWGEEPSSPAAAESARRPRILVVDDSITTRTLERNILEAVGYEVQIATDGQEALAAIAAGELPNLVISDILMPRMNGFELTAHLRGDERTADLPVILVSSLESLEHKTRGIEVGADAYIVKSGFDQQSLLDTIEQLI